MDKPHTFKADTYHQVYLHIVFAVKHRQYMIGQSFSEELQKYMTGIIENKGNKLLAIKAMPDHVHIFMSYVPTCYIPDMVREIKVSSTEFIKRKGWAQGFQWQESYGVFSYSKSHISRVINYIQHQEEHHRRKSFKEEYIKILKDFEIKYEEKSNISPLQGSMGVVGPICYRQNTPSGIGLVAVYGWSCFIGF